MVLFVTALNAMHVGVLQGGGGYFWNISLGYYQFTIPLAFKTVANLAGFIFNIVSLEEQRKISHVKNEV